LVVTSVVVLSDEYRDSAEEEDRNYIKREGGWVRVILLAAPSP
jgi:hypothetical protein